MKDAKDCPECEHVHEPDGRCIGNRNLCQCTGTGKAPAQEHTFQDSVDEVRRLRESDQAYYKQHGHRWYDDCYCDAPESPEARVSILELPEDQQVELYTRAAERSNEMQREVLERVQQPEATKVPAWVDEGDDYCATCDTAFKDPEEYRKHQRRHPQPQQNAGELEAWIAEHNEEYEKAYEAAKSQGHNIEYHTFDVTSATIEALKALIARRELAAVELFIEILFGPVKDADGNYYPGQMISADEVEEALNQFKEEMK